MGQLKAPKSLVWRKKNEGLNKGCTSKGNKAGHGGKVASFFVALSLGKGICYLSITRNLVINYLVNL